MRADKHQKQRGFSLIELMIVISIIGILVAVGVPAWRNAVINSNEAAAIQSLSTISKEQRGYSIGHKGYGTFTELVDSGSLNKRFSSEQPTVDGYTYKMSVTAKSANTQPSYTILASPASTGGIAPTGRRFFYLDSGSDTLKFNDSKEAGPDDEPLGK